MACLVKRDSENNIVGVTTPQGVKSKLFEEIHSIPYLADASMSVDIMKNAFTNRVEKLFEQAQSNVYDTGEPQIFFKTDKGEIYDSIEDIVINKEQGITQVGFKNPNSDAFIPIAQFDMQGGQQGEFITSAISQGFLSPRRVLMPDGSTRFQGKGQYREIRKASAQGLKFDFAVEHGREGVKVFDDGTLTMNFENNLTFKINSDGTTSPVRVVDIPEVLKEESPQNKSDLLSLYIVDRLYNNLEEDMAEELPENFEAIFNNFKYLLKSLGFTTTTLEEYGKNYKTRTGNNWEIQAISDMASKVIAFSEGGMTLETLSEEVAHVAIEFYNDQNSIVSALSNVHLTKEYREFSEAYRSKYGSVLNEQGENVYQGAELETQVRKEVLGKILKNEFLDRFSKEGKSKERGFIIDKLVEIWENFVNSIRSRLKTYHLQELQDLTARIAESVIKERNEDFNKRAESYNFFYDAQDKQGKKIDSDLQSARAHIENLFMGVLREPVPNEQELDKIEEGMEEVDTARAANSMVSVAISQAKILEASLKDSAAGRKVLSKTDQQRFDNVEKLKEDLDSIKVSVDKMKFSNKSVQEAFNSFKGRVRDLGELLSDIKPQMDQYKDERADAIIQEQLDRAGATQEEAREVKEKVNIMKKDISILGYNFTLMSQSQNPLMNLISKVAKDMFSSVNMEWLSRLNPTMKEISSKGYEKYQKDVIQKDSKGRATHWFFAPVRNDLLEEARIEKQVELISKLKQREDRDKIKEELNELPVGKILDSPELHKTFKDEMEAWRQQEEELPRTPEYYKERDDRYKTAGLSDATRTVIRNKNRAKATRDSKYTDNKGRVDNSLKTESEKQQDREDKQNFAKIKSPVVNGSIREGLEVVKASDLTPKQIKRLKEQGRIPKGIKIDPNFKGEVTFVAEGYTLDSVPEDARVAVDLFNLDMLYRQELSEKVKKGEADTVFLEKLREFEKQDPVSAYEWLMDNASITLTDDFFESLDTGTTNYPDLVQRWIDDGGVEGEEAIKVRANLKELLDLQRRRKHFLKIYRKANNPIETDANSMVNEDMSLVKNFDATIKGLQDEIGLPQDYRDSEVATTDVTSRQANEDFYLKQEESGKSVFDFALDHMTESNKERTREFKRSIQRYITGKTTYLKSSYEDFLFNARDEGLYDDNMSDSEVIEILSNEFAKSRVASYFQRFEPKGYAEVLEALKSGKIKPSDLIDPEKADVKESLTQEYEGLKFLEIRPDYTWTNDISRNDYVNPNYNHQGYFIQPKLFKEDGKTPKYINKEWFDFFGIPIEDFLEKGDDISQLSATKNKEAFELLKIIISNRESELELYGEDKRHSKWMRQQIHRSTMESLTSVLNPNKRVNIGDRLRDIFQYRSDEQEYGAEVNNDKVAMVGRSETVRTIPKYFLSKLKNPEDISDNVIESSFLGLKEALMYKKRQSFEADYNALLYKVGEQKFVNNGGGKKKGLISTKGEVSNYVKKAQEYVGNKLYGINQTRRLETTVLGKTVDLTRTVNVIQAWTRFSNLAYNWIVDATSLTTGVSVNLSDRLSGQFYHSSSANRANTLSTQVFKYIAEEGQMDKSSEMNHMFELFGVTTPDERLKNSNFGRGIRLLDTSPYFIAKVSNMGIKPKVLMSNLVDTRYIEGAWRSYPQYYNFKKNQDKNISKSAIESLFKEAKYESVYDHLEITKQGIKPNSKFNEKFDNPQEEFQKVVQDIASKTEVMIQITDTVISSTDRLSAQRDVLSNTLMMHKGWLPINLTKRFKGSHFDFHTGQVEEGHYVTLGNTLTKLAKSKSFKEALGNLSYAERSNVKRVAYESAMMTAIIILGRLIFAEDDDDDTYLEDLAQYIYLRTAKELSSADLTGMTKSIFEVAKSPITAISTLELLEPIELVKSLFSIDKDEYLDLIKKGTPLKRIDQLSDIQEQMNSYWHFNTAIPFSHPIREERRQKREEKKKEREKVKETLKSVNRW